MSIETLGTNITKVKHLSLQHVNSCRILNDGFIAAPKSIILDGIISYGGATGHGLTTVHKSFGEYFERNHFFTAVPISAQKPLKDTKLHLSLASLCVAKQNFFDHNFSLTNVYNIFSNNSYEYLYNAISLRSSREDSQFIKMNDSCGCASHITKAQALNSSLLEFIERQAIIGSWISKTVNYSIDASLLRAVTPYKLLVENLLENGAIYIYEVSKLLPGYNIVMYYFANNSQDAVQFSIGSKTSGSLKEAIRSAFEELYQCYTFLYGCVFKESNLENKAGSAYHQNFISYNNLQTREIIPYKTSTHLITNIAQLKTSEVYDYRFMLEKLQTISKKIFYYHNFDACLGLHFTKILSPDFFSHMSIDHSLNLDCLYANKLNITKANANLTMLPFP